MSLAERHAPGDMLKALLRLRLRLRQLAEGGGLALCRLS